MYIPLHFLVSSHCCSCFLDVCVDLLEHFAYIDYTLMIFASAHSLFHYDHIFAVPLLSIVVLYMYQRGSKISVDT